MSGDYRMQISLPETLMERLDRYCDRTGAGKASVIRIALDAFLKQAGEDGGNNNSSRYEYDEERLRADIIRFWQEMNRHTTMVDPRPWSSDSVAATEAVEPQKKPNKKKAGDKPRRKVGRKVKQILKQEVDGKASDLLAESGNDSGKLAGALKQGLRELQEAGAEVKVDPERPWVTLNEGDPSAAPDVEVYGPYPDDYIPSEEELDTILKLLGKFNTNHLFDALDRGKSVDYNVDDIIHGRVPKVNDHSAVVLFPKTRVIVTEKQLLKWLLHRYGEDAELVVKFFRQLYPDDNLFVMRLQSFLRQVHYIPTETVIEGLIDFIDNVPKKKWGKGIVIMSNAITRIRDLYREKMKAQEASAG